jgi:hypothetical protein
LNNINILLIPKKSFSFLHLRIFLIKIHCKIHLEGS